MKQLFFTIVTILAMSTGAFSQAGSPKGKPVKHQCTAACTKEKHMYAHGEKGHVCSSACKIKK